MTTAKNPSPAPRGLFARIAWLEPAPPWGWNAAILTLIVSVIAVVIVSLFITTVIGVRSYGIYLGWLIVALIMAYWAASTRRSDTDRAAMRLNPPPLPFILIVFVGIGFALAFDLLSLAVTSRFLPVMELFAFDITSATVLDWLFAGVFMLVAQPVGEELVFRGVWFPLLRAKLGAWFGLVANAALYAIFHLALYTSQQGSLEQTTLIWYGLLLPFLHGLVIAAVRAYTRSTRAAIYAHSAFGLFALLKLFTLTG